MAQDYAIPFYHSPQWKRCRKAFMISKFYICERCDGVADIVHHRQHITPDNINNPMITLSWDNLEALCIECHNAAHGSGEATADGISFDAGGNIVYTPLCDKKN